MATATLPVSQAAMFMIITVANPATAQRGSAWDHATLGGGSGDSCPSVGEYVGGALSAVRFTRICGAPHFPQKVLPSGTGALQRWQG